MKSIIFNIIFLASLFFISCKRQTPDKNIELNHQNLEQYEPTEIWFDLHLSNKDERMRLDSLIDSDTTYWGVNSAPFFFRMPGVEDNSNAILNTGPFTNDTQVRIYALGEAVNDEMVDFGWLINTTTKDTIWKMTFQNTSYAGGNKRNRKYVGDLVLPSGAYQLNYLSNESHSSGSWTSEPPENPDYWGVLIYRTEVVKKIKNK